MKPITMEEYMEFYLRKNFELESKNASEEALKKWRDAVWLVKNPRRRFRMVADLDKRAEADRKRHDIQVILRMSTCIGWFDQMCKLFYCFLDILHRLVG